MILFIVFFNDTATTEIYTLSLHDALPIFDVPEPLYRQAQTYAVEQGIGFEELALRALLRRSEEHTSELQSRQYLVCRLLLEKKKKHTSTPQRLRDEIQPLLVAKRTKSHKC